MSKPRRPPIWPKIEKAHRICTWWNLRTDSQAECRVEGEGPMHGQEVRTIGQAFVRFAPFTPVASVQVRNLAGDQVAIVDVAALVLSDRVKHAALTLIAPDAFFESLVDT